MLNLTSIETYELTHRGIQNMNLLNEVPEMQNDISYDPDSSPLAYEFYKKIYGATFGKKYDLFNPHPMVYSSEDYLYYDKIQLLNNRLESLPIGISPKYLDEAGNAVYTASIRLAGETDFDFKFDKNPYKDKAGSLIDIAGGDQSVRDRLESYYSKRHHSLVNFSLMFVPGNLQGIKSEGIANEWLDRLDSLLYLLDRYYSCTDTSFIPNKPNSEALKIFLDEIGSVEAYCKLVYLIHDKMLIRKLISNGGTPIKTKEDVERYLDLADMFWEEKSKHIIWN